MSGYLHQQIEYAADDCLSGRDEITKKWGKFLKTFSKIAYAIASSEACDSGSDYPITETIKLKRQLENDLQEVFKYVQPFEDCMQEAVREALKENKNA